MNVTQPELANPSIAKAIRPNERNSGLIDFVDIYPPPWSAFATHPEPQLILVIWLAFELIDVCIPESTN